MVLGVLKNWKNHYKTLNPGCVKIRLKINSEKTEFIIFGSTKQLAKCNQMVLTIMAKG